MTHTVFFWLKPDLSEADRATFEAEIQKIGTSPNVAKARVGKPAPTQAREGVTDHSWDYTLMLDFDTQAAHDLYQSPEDEVHMTFVNTCKESWSKVMVLDAEIL